MDPGPRTKDRRMVQLGPSGFTLHDSVFFPLAVNYIASARWEGGQLWFGPAADYRNSRAEHYCPKDTASARFRADMEMIRDLGFNTVRIVGIWSDLDRDDTKDSLGLSAANLPGRDTLLLFASEASWPPYLQALEELFTICAESGLMVIPLTTIPVDMPETDPYLARYLDHFRNDTNILAFDLFNEPLYFDRLERPKQVAIRTVARWRKLMDEHAPDHLFTLGLTGIREAFEFDPELIDVDFISFHPYDYERDQVMNELAWYGKELTVPWMVGETAIPADNDSVLFDEQRAFAERTLAQARACGATGYSWWQYKDVRWHEFHPSHMGVLAREGFSRTRQGHLVEGTPKPVADVFRTFDPQAPKGPCMELPNYYNYSGHSTSRICGKLVDASGDPVRQGVIIGWDEHWSASYHTVTLDDGSFELLGDFRFHHWMATGLRYSVKRGDPGEDLFTAAGDSIPTYDLGTITLYGTDRWGSLLEWADRKMQRFGDGHSRVGP
ncbi:MAG: hypothetical protein KBF80_11215 [Flavobacteriales bacterium]|nr:hypothetical protein [Flavobacteriales bacterium]